MAVTLSYKRAKYSDEVTQDQQALLQFEALFEQHWGRVCQVIYRITGDWDEAQDLALETFIRLHQRPPAEQAGLSGWLYRVAVNLGLNHLRAQKRRRLYEAQVARDATRLAEKVSPWDPAAAAEQAQERESVRNVLMLMKPRAAQLLVLRYSGFSYGEIAEALQVAPGSVGSLLARAEKEFEQVYSRR